MSAAISLRRRVLLILAMATVALLGTGLALWKIQKMGLDERSRASFARGDAVVRALAGQVTGATRIEDPLTAAELRGFAATQLTPLIDASAGLCTPSGGMVLSETVLPEVQGVDTPEPLMHGSLLKPLDRDAVLRACRTYPASHDGHVRATAPNDLLFISVHETQGPWLAWALVRVPNRRGDDPGALWALNLGLLGLVALGLVVLTGHTLLVLRRGADSLQGSLRRLQEDLAAPVPTPQALEFARVAEGLRLMASHLHGARERERSLSQRLDHEQRLAGLGRVVAGVAHEIRNPLAGMKLKLDGMARRRLDDRSARDVEICLHEVARLDRVVSTLLLVARKGAVETAPVALGALLRDRCEAAQALASQAGVELRCEGDALAPAHTEHLTRVIDNLLRNAIEASPPGAAVEARVEVGAQGACLQVSDPGPGVPAEREAELFEPFFTLKPEGTGLGLFLSRSLVEAHGGSLRYRRADERTHFEVFLPMEKR